MGKHAVHFHFLALCSFVTVLHFLVVVISIFQSKLIYNQEIVVNSCAKFQQKKV
jgi:hypothetical protein